MSRWRQASPRNTTASTYATAVATLGQNRTNPCETLSITAQVTSKATATARRTSVLVICCGPVPVPPDGDLPGLSRTSSAVHEAAPAAERRDVARAGGGGSLAEEPLDRLAVLGGDGPDPQRGG